jgi:glycosyltransferase involved in cell wall biosynthesis
LRIALIHNLPSGGAKRFIAETLCRLPSDYDVDAWLPTTAEIGFCSELQWVRRCHRVPCRAFPRARRPFGRLNGLMSLCEIASALRAFRRIARAVAQASYDCLFVHPCQWLHCPPYVAGAGTPAVFYCQEVFRMVYGATWPWLRDPVRALHLAVARAVDRRAMSTVRAILTNSSFTAGTIARAYGARAQVIHPGVDTEFFRPMSLTRERVVLSVGALTKPKGHRFVLECVARVPVEMRPLLLIISNYEDPWERGALESRAAETGVELRVLVGASDEELRVAYNRACLFAYAPVEEPFGLAPLEAMACETPVVAVAEGGPAESVLHGRTGLLCVRDHEQFAGCMASLLTNASLAREYGVAGRKHVQGRFTWERTTDLLCACMRSVSSPASGGGPQAFDGDPNAQGALGPSLSNANAHAGLGARVSRGCSVAIDGQM